MANEELTYEVMSRKEASERGLKHYFTGKPCKRGHISLRRVSGLNCTKCSAQKLREWRSKDIEKYRRWQQENREKNREKLRAQGRARYAKNPQKYVEKTRRYYRNNGEEVREKRKAYHYETYKDPKVRKAAQERSRQWARENPEQAWVSRQISRIKRRGLKVEGVHTAEDIKRIFKAQRGKCAYCRGKVGDDYHVDHIIALSRGGTNWPRNLQITCSRCNMEKHARDPIAHAQMLGMLL